MTQKISEEMVCSLAELVEFVCHEDLNLLILLDFKHFPSVEPAFHAIKHVVDKNGKSALGELLLKYI